MLRISPKKSGFFSFFVLFFLGANFLAILLAMGKIFYAPILAIYLLAGAAFLIFILYKYFRPIKFSYQTIAVVIFSFLAVGIFSYYTTPTIFSGRDQGSLSEAAVRLAQNHQLPFSTPASQEFFKIYGPGTALNFPGFAYQKDGQLITQFPLGYIAWLAIFYSLFGLKGLILANAISFFIFLISFYFLSRQYLSKNLAPIPLLFVVTSLVFSWFFKFTLSENLALPFVWIGVYYFSLFFKDHERLNLFLSLLSFSLLAFLRLEAFLFIFAEIIILLFSFRDKNYLFRHIIGKEFFIAFFILATTYIINIALNFPLYKSTLKGLLNSFGSLELSQGSYFSPFTPLWYVMRVFSTYGLIDFLLISTVAFLIFAIQRKWHLLVPFFILSPSFFYLFNPSISADHPWMLRRFLFTVIPTCMLYAIIFFDHYIKRKWLLYFLAGMILVSNMLLSAPYIKFSENKNLLSQTENLSQNFNPKDLVLVDRFAVGDNWSMPTGPMNFFFGTQAAYLFNASDLEKIGLEKFDHIYFIIPNQSLSFWRENGIMAKLEPIKDYRIETTALDAVVGNKKDLYFQAIFLPQPKRIITQGSIYQLKK